MNTGRIRDLMEVKKISSYQLAQKVGVPKSTIYRVLNGEIPDPRVSIVLGIAESLDVTIDEIVKRKE